MLGPGLSQASISRMIPVFSGGCGGATGTYTKTWTVTDQCGRTASGSASVEVVDTTPPDIVCPGADDYNCASNLEPEPAIANAVDACHGDVVPVYNGCCFSGEAGIDLSLDRTWSASDR